MLEEKKRTWAEVKISAIGWNYDEIRAKMPKGCRLMGMVKADAYGHGAVAIARFLEIIHCDYLAVAAIDEAKELRKAGNKLPILILGTTRPEFAGELFELDVTQSVGSLESAKAYSDMAVKAGKTLRVHYKLETGMGRLGFDVKTGDLSEVLEALKLPNIEPEGVFTHFAAPDELSKDDYTKKQFKAFTDAIDAIERASGVHFAIRHCANSGAVVNYPEMYLDMVRPGIALYGMYPGPDKGGLRLAPAMELKSRIVAVSEHEAGDCISYGCTFTAERKMKVAVLPIGYADGLHRVLSGKIDVLVHGQRCRQIGRICMDMCMVDVTDVPNVKTGDVATIFGHDGHEVISANEVAEKAGTISYEIFCALSKRVPRVYTL